MVDGLVSPPVFPHLQHQDEPPSTTLARLAHASEQQGAELFLLLSWLLIAHTYITRASSAVLPSQGVGATLPSAAAGERRQGHLASYCIPIPFHLSVHLIYTIHTYMAKRI